MTADPMRHHHAHRNLNPFGDGLVPRLASKVADAMGTVQFVIISTVVIVAWLVVNGAIGFLEDSWKGLLSGRGFDPAPFILLNLLFSAVAYYSASMVMIAQKAQTRRDDARELADAQHREELASFQVTLLHQNLELTRRVQALTEQLCGTLGGVMPGSDGAISPHGRRDAI